MLERKIRRYSAYFRGWCQTFGEHECIPGTGSGIHWLVSDRQVGFILPKKLTRPLYREILHHPDAPTMVIQGPEVQVGSFRFSLAETQQQPTLEAVRRILEGGDEFHVFLTSHFMYGTHARIITLSSRKPLPIIYKEVGNMKIRMAEQVASEVETLHVVVASANPAKMRAVQEAFALQLADVSVGYTAVAADSGVGDQPGTDEETRKGARNRAMNARRAHPEGDYWIGLEGGIESSEEQLTAFAWMAVLDRNGQLSMTRTVSLPLPSAVRELVEQGLELGEANDQVFATVNSKHKGGAFGLLTDGAYTRESVYTEALVMALLPFTHALYRQEPDSR